MGKLVYLLKTFHMRKVPHLALVLFCGQVARYHVEGFTIGRALSLGLASIFEDRHIANTGDKKLKNGRARGVRNMATAVHTSTGDVEVKSETRCFEGRLLSCVHQSVSTSTPMMFSIFLPPEATSGAPVPVRSRSYHL